MHVSRYYHQFCLSMTYRLAMRRHASDGDVRRFESFCQKLIKRKNEGQLKEGFFLDLSNVVARVQDRMRAQDSANSPPDAFEQINGRAPYRRTSQQERASLIMGLLRLQFIPPALQTSQLQAA